MRNNSNCSPRRKSHDSSLKAEYRKRNRANKGSAKQEEWNQILKEISHVTTKVKKLYDGSDKLNKASGSSHRRKESIIHQQGAYIKRKNICHVPLTNCFLYEKQEKIPIKKQLKPSNEKVDKQRKSKLQRAISYKKKNKTFDVKRSDTFHGASIQTFENKYQHAISYKADQKYEELQEKYYKLELAYKVLLSQKQFLLNKLYEESYQRGCRQILKNQEDQRATRRVLDVAVQNKQNNEIKTPKKMMEKSRKALGTRVENLQNVLSKEESPSHILCSFTDQFKSECINSRANQKQASSIQSLLIDISKSPSNKGQPYSYSLNNQSTNIEGELIRLLQKCKFQKDNSEKQSMRRLIYKILSQFGVEFQNIA